MCGLLSIRKIQPQPHFQESMKTSVGALSHAEIASTTTPNRDLEYLNRELVPVGSL